MLDMDELDRVIVYVYAIRSSGRLIGRQLRIGEFMLRADINS